MTARIVRLGAAELIVVDEDGADLVGASDADGYESTKYPDLDPVLDALAGHGWEHHWAAEDLVILHHHGAGRFVLLERDERKRRWPATALVELMTEAGGTIRPAPPL